MKLIIMSQSRPGFFALFMHYTMTACILLTSFRILNSKRLVKVPTGKWEAKILKAQLEFPYDSWEPPGTSLVS